MRPHRLLRAGVPVLFLVTFALCAYFSAGRADDPESDKTYGIKKRVPWTTSRVKGSPEPPLPYRVEMAFPHVNFDYGVDIVMGPGTGRFFIAEQWGKVWSFRADPACKKKDLAIDLTKELKTLKDVPNVDGVDQLYGIAFHPKFKENRYVYLCYILKRKNRDVKLPEGSRV